MNKRTINQTDHSLANPFPSLLVPCDVLSNIVEQMVLYAVLKCSLSYNIISFLNTLTVTWYGVPGSAAFSVTKPAE